MTNRNSREWLLENTALPLIETLAGKRVGFGISTDGDFYITSGDGYIHNGGAALGMPCHAPTAAESVEKWWNKFTSMHDDEAWTPDLGTGVFYRYVVVCHQGVILPVERPGA